MTQARIELDDYSARVLDVIKGKYGLKNRNDALLKFFELFGSNFIEPEFDEKESKAIRSIVNNYEKNGKNKSMSMKELDKILGL